MINDDRIKVKSLAKAVEVLNCFTEKQYLGVTEISGMLGLPKSNIHNILSTYEALGYVEQDPDSGKYFLGHQVYKLSHSISDKYKLDKILQPYIKDLANITGETVIVSVPADRKVMYIGGEYPDIPGVYTQLTYMGNRNDMYCTSTGKAMLAFMNPEQREMYLDCELKPKTRYTITDKAQLLKELDIIKERGYATDHMEFEMGLSCIAAPLLDKHGRLVGTFTISGLSERIEGPKAKMLAEYLVTYAKKAEKIL